LFLIFGFHEIHRYRCGPKYDCLLIGNMVSVCCWAGKIDAPASVELYDKCTITQELSQIFEQSKYRHRSQHGSISSSSEEPSFCRDIRAAASGRKPPDPPAANYLNDFARYRRQTT